MDPFTAPSPGTVVVRPARPSDLPALAALLERCSDETVYRRFHGASGRSATRELERIAHPGAGHHSWVAEVDRVLRGTATLAWGADGVPEAAFLVEDGWFRRGLGRRLFRAVARDAHESATERVVVAIQADNERARRFLRAVAPGAQTTFSGGGALEMSVPVAHAGAVPDHRPAATTRRATA
jgi:predicted N-acetyltransferase YhbS